MTRRTYEELEESNDTNECGAMSERSHVRSELLPLGENWSKEQRNEEKGNEHGGVPNDRADCDEGDPDEWAWRLVSTLVREGLDEHVGDHKDSRRDQRPDDLREKDSPPASSWYVARKFL